MARQNAIGRSLKTLRLARELTQEDFVEATGRTYISQLEREIKSPTLDKVDELANVLNVHPLTLLTLAYLPKMTDATLKKLQSQVQSELSKLLL